jgi:DNA topoisomerase I
VTAEHQETEALILPPPTVSAEAADLVYVSDAEPGISRRRTGRGFSYRGPTGERVTDKETLGRIRSLAIPPAYQAVWICTVANGHLQATGRDARGRKQYRYHPRWFEVRDQAKYDGLIGFAGALPVIRDRVNADMRRRSLSRGKVLASIVWLLEHTFVRIGNANYARDNRSFGLTTLRSRHIQVNGTEVRLKFKGKSGKLWDLGLRDRRIMKVVRACHELPGQHLFQFTRDGKTHAVTSHDVNAYIREISGAEFSSKHFRTWAGTVQAASLLADEAPPTSATDAKRKINTVLDQVAARLGNTRAVCRRCYVHPRVFERYAEGRLSAELSEVSTDRVPEGLDVDEQRVLAWLSRENGVIGDC